MINNGYWSKGAFVASLILAVGTAWAQAVSVYPYPMDPRQHPDDARRSVKPPDQATFKNKLQFIALRSLSQNYRADLDLYTQKDKLGDVVGQDHLLGPDQARFEVAHPVTQPLVLGGEGVGGSWASGSTEGLEAAEGTQPAPLGDVAAVQALPADDRALGAGRGRVVELVEDGHLVRGADHAPIRSPVSLQSDQSFRSIPITRP